MPPDTIKSAQVSLPPELLGNTEKMIGYVHVVTPHHSTWDMWVITASRDHRLASQINTSFFIYFCLTYVNSRKLLDQSPILKLLRVKHAYLRSSKFVF
jgi:hypothetical protein